MALGSAEQSAQLDLAGLLVGLGFFRLLLFKTTDFQKSVKLFCNSLCHQHILLSK